MSAGSTLFGQNDFLTPAENLVVEGVPKIPRDLTEEADRYTNFRFAGLESWHFVRREMLIITRFGDTRNERDGETLTTSSVKFHVAQSGSPHINVVIRFSR